MNYVFIFQSKCLFSQGGVLQFWGILVSYGEKIGYIGIPLAPWLSLIEAWKSQDFNGVWTRDLAHLTTYYAPIIPAWL